MAPCTKTPKRIVKDRRRRAVELATRNLRLLLPKLHRYLGGQECSARSIRCWLGGQMVSARLLPSVQDFCLLLQRLAKPLSGQGPGPAIAWKTAGIDYVDESGDYNVSNVAGFKCKVLQRARRHHSWHERGDTYHLEACRQRRYRVVRRRGMRVVGTMAKRKVVRLRIRTTKARFPECWSKVPLKQLDAFPFESNYWADGVRPREAVDCRLIVLEAPKAKERWSLIFLHGFSGTAALYAARSHIFSPEMGSLRVVLPTAPLKAQTCFDHWPEWHAASRKYRDRKFRSWFNYLTDKSGRCENAIDFSSLFETRRVIHGIIQREVQLVGDPRRVIVGGTSQGACTALDAAFTFPELLGGAIGLVGHVLSCTPINELQAREMPVFLFHETTDKEMNWRWVSHTVQRMRAEGCQLVSRRERDPNGDGHWIGDIDCKWIRRALGEIMRWHAARGT